MEFHWALDSYTFDKVPEQCIVIIPIDPNSAEFLETDQHFYSFTVKSYKNSVVLRTVAGQWICPAFKVKATQATVNPLYTSFFNALTSE